MYRQPPASSVRQPLPANSATQRWTPVHVPFETPDRPPFALPKDAEIIGGTFISGSIDNHLVVEVGTHFIAKYGRNVTEVEGQNMLFVKQFNNAAFNTPTLYAMWHMTDIRAYKCFCLLMEKVPGRDLSSLWPRLSSNAKDTICNILKESFKHLRSLKPFASFYGGISGGPFSGPLFWSMDNDAKIMGPFRSEAQFNGAFIELLKVISKYNRGSKKESIEKYQQTLNIELFNHPPVFTHTDLQLKNILYDEKSGKVYVIDWEDAGWYPNYWEYAYTRSFLGSQDSWMKRLGTIVGTFPNEAAVIRRLFGDIGFPPQ